ncbi:hypothetical protein LQZ19_01275 [Treponema primitia]|uniref:tetratricopeptide repeat protein n=1 Tax=Treponema primitia TaxID=88058 RepID=UPI00397F7BAD
MFGKLAWAAHLLSRERKSGLCFLFFFLALIRLPALDLGFRLRPYYFIPLGETGDNYQGGYGGDLLFDVDVSGILTNPLGIGYGLGLEAGIGYAGLAKGTAGDIQPYSAGLGARVFYYPLSRLLVTADGAFGLHQTVQHLENRGDGYTDSWWWRVGGEAGFRFNPSFILSFAGGWKNFNNAAAGRPILSGIYAGLTAQFTFATRSSSADVQAVILQDDPVFPLFLSLYRGNPAGTVRITNNENAEIRNVRLSFRAGNYTASEYPCGSVALLPKNRSVEFPLYADFSPALLNFTENGRIVGELVIRYTFLGKEREAVRNGAVQIYNRNNVPSGDPAALAAFVSPANPEVLEAAKYFAGLARSNRRSGLNRNMEFGAYLFEGLLAGELRLREDADARTPGVDSIQFPVHTLAFRSGTAADLGLLFAALLEGTGISAAVIPLEDDDFIIAYSLGIGAAAADSLFNDMGKLLVIDEEVWLPLSMAAFNRGFINSWEWAAERLQKIFLAGETVDFVSMEDAWTLYPPAPLSPQQIHFIQPREEIVIHGAALALDRYVLNELEPKIAALADQIRSSPTAALYNRLGLLNLRAGHTAEARTAFEWAASQSSPAGMVNLGNMALQELDLSAADRWFKQALAQDPNRNDARRGLDRVAAEQEE